MLESMENQILTERIKRIGQAAGRAGLPVVRVDHEDGGAVILLSGQPDRYVEVLVDRDGLAQAVVRRLDDEDEPSCCGLADLATRMRQLAEFVRTGSFSLDSLAA
jgi:hypothetical protein